MAISVSPVAAVVFPVWRSPDTETATARRGATARRPSTPVGAATAPDGRPLDGYQQSVVERLRAIDQRVRTHEAAHQAAAGAAAGPATYRYVLGPDGRLYAVGGEVPIRIEPGRTPEETIANAEQVRAAALATGDPSPQDLAVAAQAAAVIAAAQAEKASAASSGARRTNRYVTAYERAVADRLAAQGAPEPASLAPAASA